MTEPQQQSGELSRSHSLPILNREEVVLKKLQDHDGIISLMQTQIEFQSELIAKHDKTFEVLLSQVQELSSKVKSLEESFSQKSEEEARSALWSKSSKTGAGGTSPKPGGNKTSSIADMVKETAEQALGIGGEDETQVQSGFVFDEKLGLYFDHSSGYYYDPVKQLYYNGHTKTFYSYDAATNTYKVHNSTTSGDSLKRKKKKSKVKKQTKHKKVSDDQIDQSEAAAAVAVASPQSPAKDDEELPEDGNPSSPQASSQKSPGSPPSDMEEGEISTSAESSPNRNQCTNSSDDDNESSSGENSDEDTQQNSFPPCIRAVVQESPKSVKCLKKGTLFLVPYTGGSIGSRGNQHALLLPCPSVEKNHAQIDYFLSESSSTADTDGGGGDQQNGGSDGGGKYFITDLGSTHGTYLNRARLSECGVKSEPQELVHGSTLQVGEDVTLLIHIHPGDFTCGHCEPGLILQKEPLYEYTGNTGETARRSEIKKLKKKYGLDRKNVHVGVGAVEGESGGGPAKAKYVDRAKNRRVKLGSDNPFAKTEVASTHTPIKQSNKGFKMLQKMGWKGGEGLGKSENQGIKEPIDSGEAKIDRLGLGIAPSSSTGIPPPLPPSKFKPSKRMENLSKTVERFKEAKSLDPAAPDFEEF